jgi:hypothetical protein
MSVGVMKDYKQKLGSYAARIHLFYFIYFIMNQQSESYRQDLYMRIGPMKD